MTDSLDTESRVAEASRFCAEWMAANPDRLAALREAGVLSDSSVFDVRQCLHSLSADPAQPDAVMRALRRARNEALFVIAWRDLSGLADLEEVLADLSALADGCIDLALMQAQAELSARYGRPRPRDGDSVAMIVIAMGKLGGRELNFSSDVDLVFAYSPADATNGQHSIDAAEFYKRVARRLLQVLSETTEDGFVYRVDTRLRPFGEAGPLVASVNAMESYYQSHGREWERYALIKARPVAGALEAGRALLARLQPFVYRRYLDYGAFESIREIKAQIEKQVVRRDQEDNIKTGRGGIREIEFVVQAFQLIRGGHEPALQDTALLPVLGRIEQAGHLPAHVARDLAQAYRFLRRLENRLQMWADRQTHELPSDDDQRRALAVAMGYADWQVLTHALADWRQRVEEHFRQVFAAPQAEDVGDDLARDLRLAWSDEGNDEIGIDLLRTQGFADPEQSWARLTGLRGNSLYQGLGERGRRRLAQLIPLLVRAVANADAPDTTLARIAGVIEKILGRTAYVALLVENPGVLSQLVTLCGASPWITRQIQGQPMLLDTLLDPRLLYQPPARTELDRDLQARLATIPESDLEQRMDCLRRFQQEQTLRVAAADATNSMPLMIVSDHLTDLAEVVVNTALSEAWREVTSRHGLPRRPDDRVAHFTVIGYGKLGGLELGYGSDLDLVFLHDGADAENTDGERPLSHPAFFLRLAQRLIHLLSTQTGAGRAYEVDTRLRPSGRAGLLVVGMNAFEQYQMEKAWTWEHQALVRARSIAGDSELAEAFGAMRARILGQPRDVEALRSKVSEMRERMRGELDRSDSQWFDIKQGQGGLVDIEFIAQYAVLRWGAECEELLLFSDTIRILETLESAELLRYADAKALTDAYRAYRRAIHNAALQEAPRGAYLEEFADERSAVGAVWSRWLEND